MDSNLKIRVLKNCVISGRNFKNALGFSYVLDDKNKKEVFVVPSSMEQYLGKTTFLRGDGHIRMDVKRSFLENLKTQDPNFEDAFNFYSSLVGTLKTEGLILGCGC